ncbi:MAG: glucose 1-dehydrogenase [Chloroflexi bacterium]|nr:glucose 1-dehydrogenase [Chloroflexota bacterium]
MSLQGKIAIVTGAGRGIGKATALRLARGGADVAVVDIDASSAEDTAREVQAIGRRTLAQRVDVTQRSEISAFADQVVDQFGHLDVMVANAGIVQVKFWLELDDVDLDRMFAVNIKGVIYSGQAAARHMMGQRSGRIINIASVAAKFGRPLYLHYGASKAAVVNLTRAEAYNLAAYGVTANSVCPGIVDTKMWEYLDEALGRIEGRPKGETIKQRLTTIPMGRLEVPEDVAGVVAFLASDEAGYITGQSVIVDGGTFME